MKTGTYPNHLGLIAVAACLGLLGATASAQHIPGAHGSLDAVEVVPSASQPATSQPAATGPLPAGHMPVKEGLNSTAIPGHPKKGPSTGALRVVFTQGTKGGPALGKDAVRVELMAKGVILKTYPATIDEKGMIELHDLPLETMFQPIVTVIHGGAEEQAVGPPMHRYQPAIQMDMKVYETTAEKPEWTVGIRYVKTEPMMVDNRLVLRVTEIVGINNPLERAWVGETVDGVAQTFAIVVPSNAENVMMGPGMAEAGAKVINGKLVRGKTLLPGPREYIFGYDVVIKEGKAALSFTAPGPTTLFALYAPGDSKVESKEGLDLGVAGGQQAEEARHLLKTHNMKAGQTVSVQLSGLKMPPPPTTKPAETVEQSSELNLTVPTSQPQTQPQTRPESPKEPK